MSAYRKPRPSPRRFVDVAELEPGAVVRHHGEPRKVLSVTRSVDRYHWRLRLAGVDQVVIVPPTARFTIAEQAA